MIGNYYQTLWINWYNMKTEIEKLDSLFKKNFVIPLIFLFLISFATRYFFIINYPGLYHNDAFEHVRQAEEIYKGEVTLQWMPLFHVVLGFFMLFSTNVVYVKMVSALIGSLSICSIYLFSREFFKNETVAFLSSLSISFLLGHLVWTTVPYADGLFLMWMFLGFREHLRGKTLLRNIFITLACASRVEAWYLIPIFLISDYKKPDYKYNAILFVFPVFWSLLNFVITGNPMAWVINRHTTFGLTPNPIDTFSGISKITTLLANTLGIPFLLIGIFGIYYWRRSETTKVIMLFIAIQIFMVLLQSVTYYDSIKYRSLLASTILLVLLSFLFYEALIEMYEKSKVDILLLMLIFSAYILWFSFSNLASSAQEISWYYNYFKTL